MKFFLKFLTLWLMLNCYGQAQELQNKKEYQIAIHGNSYLIAGNKARLTNQGIENWRDSQTIIATYFYFQKPQQQVKMSLLVKGKGKYKIKIDQQEKNINFDSVNEILVPVGNFNDLPKGYQKVEFYCIDSDNNTNNIIKQIVLEDVLGEMNYVRDFSEYWGRRGASVHLFYPLPKGQEIEYFYNEVTVEKGDDIIGSYFMVNGFNFGYFGMQVNSEQERRVLFSVWSPANVQNPKDIPEDKKIKCLAFGKNVHVGEFGNEGAGGQSFLRYPWRAGETYKFLLRVHPQNDNSTIFTAYFYAPELNKWTLIASFKRPYTHTWYQGAHSFLENFLPQNGFLSRKVYFGNQWVRNNKGQWLELLECRFSCDETGSRKVRLDFSGGISSDHRKFILQNGGFSNQNTPAGKIFKRISLNKEPEINFNEIEKMIP